MIDGVDPSCTGKTPHVSKSDAIKALNRRTRRMKGRPCTRGVVIYRCNRCHHWHVGG